MNPDRSALLRVMSRLRNDLAAGWRRLSVAAASLSAGLRARTESVHARVAARDRVRSACAHLGRAAGDFSPFATRTGDLLRTIGAFGARVGRSIRRAGRRTLSGARQVGAPTLIGGTRWAGRHRKGLLLGGVLVTAALTAWGSSYYLTCGLGGCPDIGNLVAWQPGGTSVLLDRNGEHVADLAPFERSIVTLRSLPEHVPSAFVTVEDRRFWNHAGVDWVRVAGAALVNVRSRSVREGSSTISMQLARNVFPEELPGTQRTLHRKIREVRVARLIERRFEKAEILEMYLNHIYFGGGAYGIESAAGLYFDKGAAELTVAEVATLAALPKAPAHYDPRRHPESSRERRDLILGLMEREGVIDAQMAETARDTEVRVRPGAGLEATIAGYFLDLVRTSAEEEFGAQLYTNRLRIVTTLDRSMQEAAEEELDLRLHAVEEGSAAGSQALQGAVVFLEARTGAVLALVGGRGSATSRYNRATLGQRQLGSAFKPFVFAAALDAGVPTSRLLSDLPLRMQLSSNDVWIPANYDRRFEGDISMRETLVRSRNLPTIRLAAEVGIDRVARTARESGLDTAMDETPSLALGTVATSPLQVAGAYTTFATLGSTATPYFVVRVEDDAGRVLWEPPVAAPARTMDPRVAYLVTDILSDAVNRGTGAGVRSAGYRGPAAGKTGTTNDATDAWFIGFTPEVVGAVWIGYDRPASLGTAATGGGLAAPVWGRIMERSRPAPASAAGWTMPSGMVRADVDPETGLLLAERCGARSAEVRTELFLAEHRPELTCPSRGLVDRVWARIRGGDRTVQTPSRVEPLRAEPLRASPRP